MILLKLRGVFLDLYHGKLGHKDRWDTTSWMGKTHVWLGWKRTKAPSVRLAHRDARPALNARLPNTPQPNSLSPCCLLADVIYENYFKHWVFGMATVWDVKDAGFDTVTQVLVNKDVTHCSCLVDDRCCEPVSWGTSQLMFTHLESNGAKDEARHSDCVALSAPLSESQHFPMCAKTLG